jgi:WD40 repeat protein
MSGLGKTAKLTRRWEAHLGDHVISMAWSPDGRRLACAAVGGPITVLDGVTGETVRALAGHGFGTTCVAWSADGAHLASAGQDGKVKLWEPGQDRERLSLAGGAAWVEKVAWCSVVNLLASSAGKKVRLWDTQGKMVREYPDHPSTVADLAWQPKAEILATAAYGALTLWRTDSDQPYRRFEWKGSMLALAWSLNGKYLATGDQDCTVHFWLVKKGEDLMMSGYPAKVRELSWDASSRYLATGGGPTPCVWDCSGKGPAGTEPVQLEGHAERVSALAYQHAGSLLASGGADAMLGLWLPAKQSEPLSLENLAAPLTTLAWSPDDRRLAAGTEEGTVSVWALEEGPPRTETAPRARQDS